MLEFSLTSYDNNFAHIDDLLVIRCKINNYYVTTLVDTGASLPIWTGSPEQFNYFLMLH